MRDERFFEDLARVASGAVGALGAVRGEVEALVRQRLERLSSDLNLVTREEFETVEAMASAARSEQERLADRVAALEARIATLEAQSPPTSSRET